MRVSVKSSFLAFAVVFLAVGQVPAALAHEPGEHAICKKKDKTIKVKGKTNEDKKKACEKAGGKWIEANDDHKD